MRSIALASFHVYNRVRTYLAKREQDSKEESGRLIQRFPQSIIQMNVQFPSVHLHILPNPIEKDSFQKDPDLVRFEIRDEDLCTSERCVRGPFCGFGESD